VTAARAALLDAHDGTVSPPERELAAALRAAGVTRIRAGVRVGVGRRWFWLDFAVVELRLAVEVDGVVAHTAPAVFRADRSRQNALVRAGWTVLRYTPFEIRTRREEVVAEIAATIAALEVG
jgi:very-short-patch-repair endonuclease